MPGDPVITLGIGIPFVGAIAYVGLAYARQAGKKGEAGMDMPFAVISAMVALGIAFSLGQSFPYVGMFDWFHSMMALRQPCC